MIGNAGETEEAKRARIETRKAELEVADLEHIAKNRPGWLARFLTNPVGGLMTTALIGIGALIGSAYTSHVNHKNQIDADTRKHQAELIKQATASGTRSEITGRVQTLRNMGLVPLFKAELDAFFNSQTNPDPVLPQSGPTPPTQPQPTGVRGWVYLGKMNRTTKTWMLSSASGQLDGLPDLSANKPPETTLKDVTITTRGYKYLRGPGTPGERVKSAVSTVLSPNAKLKLLEIDASGKDPADGETVIWAQAEVVQ